MEAGGPNGASGDDASRLIQTRLGADPRMRTGQPDGTPDTRPVAQSERMPDGRPVAAGDAPIGGQAVLEGVMMRGVSVWAFACRTPEGRIEIPSEPIVSWAKRSRIWRLPVIRGVVALAESVRIGFRALAISANAQLPADSEDEEIGGFTWGVTIFFSILLAIGLFF